MAMHARFRTLLGPGLRRWLGLLRRPQDRGVHATHQHLTTFVYQAGRPSCGGLLLAPEMLVCPNTAAHTFVYPGTDGSTTAPPSPSLH